LYHSSNYILFEARKGIKKKGNNIYYFFTSETAGSEMTVSETTVSEMAVSMPQM